MLCGTWTVLNYVSNEKISFAYKFGSFLSLQTENLWLQYHSDEECSKQNKNGKIHVQKHRLIGNVSWIFHIYGEYACLKFYQNLHLLKKEKPFVSMLRGFTV